MSIATKNGGVVLKNGRIAANCNCCGFSFDECCSQCAAIFDYEVEYEGIVYKSDPTGSGNAILCNNTSSTPMSAPRSQKKITFRSYCANQPVRFVSPGVLWEETATGQPSVVINVTTYCFEELEFGATYTYCSEDLVFLFKFPTPCCPSGQAQLSRTGVYYPTTFICNANACNRSCFGFSSATPIVRVPNAFP